MNYTLSFADDQIHSSLGVELVTSYTDFVSKELTLTSTPEVYYFNLNLNFYEPFIEEFDFNFYYKSDIENKVINLEMSEEKTLNINLTTALVESLCFQLRYILKKDKGALFEPTQSKHDVKYSLENCLGEEITYFINDSQAPNPLMASQTAMIEFGMRKDSTHGRGSMNSETTDSSTKDKDISISLRSPFRRDNFRIDQSSQQISKKLYLKFNSASDAKRSAFDDSDDSILDS